MNDEEHSCLLRRLTLCDGERCPGPLPRADDQVCHCVALAEAVEAGLDAIAQAVRIERARVCAQWQPIMRAKERRQLRW